MTAKMLIDAAHPEETRVAVIDGDHLTDFDFESSTKKQIKGNVYLAKVTRVEPSLQAAFVDYGGNRHGFLAFSEIHPDYYQIPQADRELLDDLERQAAALAAEAEERAAAEAARDDDEDEEEFEDDADDPSSEDDEASGGGEDGEVGAASAESAGEEGDDEGAEAASLGEEASSEDGVGVPASGLAERAHARASRDVRRARRGGRDGRRRPQRRREAERDDDDPSTELARQRARLLRGYKIQEVIKRRQILLVQVVKEERGNKGAALTTYLSLAGRYCVLMPNTDRGGGISRKIAEPDDRKRLKKIAQELDVPRGMGLIVRTAGQDRSKLEIRRDFDYLMRQWSEIRETTLSSVAPALIFEEGDLLKRAIRDLYGRDTDEVLVEGEAAYRSAKRFMGMLTPSHARRVKQYKGETPIFIGHGVEDKLEGMFSPHVELRSGGSIVIHATEALIAIDVNSGRSTRERHIDETALKTNLEAADEIARQLRLRDVAGLVVIDFIDMAENRHQRQVERRFREAVRADRARLQVGRISPFGLLELSRQRLRPSLQELSSQICPTCAGLGVVRSKESCAVQALRLIQEEGVIGKASVLRLSLPTEVALYVLNQKRERLARLEAQYGVEVRVEVDATMMPDQRRIERVELRPRDEAEIVEAEPARAEAGGEDEGKRRRRRRRRRDTADENAAAREDDAPAAVAEEAGEGERAAASSEEAPQRKRRRRRRNRRVEGGATDGASEARPEAVRSDGATSSPPSAEAAPSAEAPSAEAPSAEVTSAAVAEPAAAERDQPASDTARSAEGGHAATEESRPRRRRRRRSRGAEASEAASSPEGASEASAESAAVDPNAAARVAAAILGGVSPSAVGGEDRAGGSGEAVAPDAGRADAGPASDAAPSAPAGSSERDAEALEASASPDRATPAIAAPSAEAEAAAEIAGEPSSAPEAPEAEVAAAEVEIPEAEDAEGCAPADAEREEEGGASNVVALDADRAQGREKAPEPDREAEESAASLAASRSGERSYAMAGEDEERDGEPPRQGWWSRWVR